MLTLISPAKALDFSPDARGLAPTQPRFAADTALLVERCKELEEDDLRRLMGLSEPLARLNRARFQEMHPSPAAENAKPCVLAFRGDVYKGLDADSLSADDLAWAQGRLRILSGLYGLLRPLDLIQPYRLEMGTRLANPRGANLYEFWGGRISADLRRTLAGQARPTLVNLASQEYYRAVRPRELDAPVVTPVFKERRNGGCRVIGLFAKKARGMMARYAVKRRLERAEQLLDFAESGYRHAPELSSAAEWVFVR